MTSPNKLLNAARKFDAMKKAGVQRREYTRDEIELVGAWFEGDISTDALALGLGLKGRSNADRRAANALRQGMALGHVRFVWEVWKPIPSGDAKK